MSRFLRSPSPNVTVACCNAIFVAVSDTPLPHRSLLGYLHDVGRNKVCTSARKIS